MSAIKNSLRLLWLCIWALIVPAGVTLASSPPEIEEAFPQLDMDKSLFASAKFSPQAKIFYSLYNHKPEGVAIAYKLDPNKRYLVSVVGQSYIIKPLLAIRINGTRDRILKAPSGEIFLNVFNTSEATLFFRIHPNFKYGLKSIHFFECPQCVDQEEMIQLIKKEKPQLGNLLKRDHLLAAQSILDWTANATPIALSKLLHDKTNNLHQMSPEEIYNLFNLKLAAVYCGGASLFLNKVLTLFGFNSSILDFGDTNDSLTHTTVVIAKHSGDHWKYYIFDPTFNFTFQNPDTGYFLTFNELLNVPPSRIKDKIKINQRSLRKRKFLVLKEDAKICPAARKTTHDYLTCSISDYTLKRYFDQVNPQYVKNGYSKNLSGFLQLLRKRVYSDVGFSNQSSKEKFKGILKAHKIPLGYGS